MNVDHLRIFGQDPPDEAFRDELAELAQAALLFPVSEEQPAVEVAGDDVTGTQPSLADLLG